MSTLIGLGGQLRAGKDEVANYLAQHHDYVPMGMSDALNAALIALNPLIPLYEVQDWEVLGEQPDWDGDYCRRYRYIHDRVGYVEAKRIPEVRRLLQALGTEVGRDIIGQNTWVDIAERRIRADLGAGRNVVITAVRFPNELEMIKRLGGTAVWIERASEARGASEEQSAHASEDSVGIRNFPRAISNNGTLDELYDNVESLVMHLEQSRRDGYRDHWPVYDR